MFHRRTLAVAFVLCLSTFGILTSVAYGSGPPLLNPHTLVIHGDHVGGGCAYLSQLHLAPDQSAIGENEVSQDAQTCTMVVEQGTPTAPPPTGTSSASVTLSPTNTPTPPGRHAPVQRATKVRPYVNDPPPGGCTNQHSAGYYETWWEDPLSILVNSVSSQVNLNYACGVITSATCGAVYSWYDTSGWGLHDDNEQCFYDANSNVVSSDYADFRNNSFPCPWGGYNTGTVDTWYNRNNARGNKDGSLDGWSYSWSTGSCSSLLGINKQLFRTSP